MADEKGFKTRIEIDGGITNETIHCCADAGADTFVSGSFIFTHPNGYKAAINELRDFC